MNPDTTRLIDRWAGIPLCFFTSLLIWKNKKTSIGAKSIDTIVFIGIAEIGALVVSYPAIQEARKKHPKSRICFITAPAGKQTLKLMGFDENDILLIRISSIRSIFGDIAKIRNTFKKESVSAVVLEPFTRFSTLVAAWVGASKRIGCYRFLAEGSYIGKLLSHRLIYNPHLHASQTYLALVKLLDELESPDPQLKEVVTPQIKNRLKIGIPENEQYTLKNRLKTEIPEINLKKIVLLNANASDIVPLRKWPLDNFIELGKWLLENYEVTIVLTGSPEEHSASENLAREIDPERVINFAGKTTFKELIILYSLGELLVTNDSGPVHFASTTNIPIIALFGPETPKIFGPMSPAAKVISVGLACSPCISVFNQKKSSCNDNQCMKQITVEMVIKETQKILRK